MMNKNFHIKKIDKGYEVRYNDKVLGETSTVKAAERLMAQKKREAHKNKLMVEYWGTK